MEFEDVSKHIERECKRVAAAFGATEWELMDESIHQYRYREGLSEKVGALRLYWYFEEGQIDGVHVGSQPNGWCFFDRFDLKNWSYSSFVRDDRVMACGLYRLGFEDEPAFAQLSSLTAHEKLELRLSFPREFWPQKWLDEQANRTFDGE